MAAAFLCAAFAGHEAQCQTISTVAEFDLANGAYPFGLTHASDGNFYGTTFQGGAGGYGTVFRVTTNGVLTTLFAFDGSNGANPRAALVEASDGDLYGTTSYGGEEGFGTLFKLTLSGELTTLVTFNSANGSTPYASLIELSDGNFYGTTYNGGDYDSGTVFRATPTGQLTILKHFTTGTSASFPSASLIQGTNGLLYGTTDGGGGYGDGTAFQISTNGTYKHLGSFEFSTKGSTPTAPLFQHSDGNLYGTAFWGGVATVGNVFKVSPAGGITSVASFSGSNGKHPAAGLVAGNDGRLYGTTTAGGASDLGAIFKVSTNGTLTLLASFAGTNGAKPYAPLIRGIDGCFYGTTLEGGASNKGTVYRFDLTPQAPVVTVQPKSQTLLVGKAASFSAVVSSLAPVSYQWQKNESNITGATNENFSIASVSVDDAGSYRVVATSSYGSGTSSNAVLTVTLPAPPAAPSGLSVTALSSSAISLHWVNNATNATGFIIWRGSSSNSTTLQVGSAPATGRLFTNSALHGSTTYYYAVQATNAGGASAKSAVVSATTLLAPPNTPPGLAANFIDYSSVALRWTNTATNVTGLILWRGGAPDSLTQKIAVLPAISGAFTNSGLVGSTTYYYSLQASNTAGLSAKSPAAAVTTPPTPPKAPTALTATALSSNSIALKWTNAANNIVNGFVIWRGAAATATTTKIGVLSGAARSFTNFGLTPSTTYYYAVQATNSSGVSAKTAAVMAKTLAIPPAAPIGVTATVLGPNRVTISWQKTPTNAVGVTIFRSTAAGGPFVAVTNVISAYPTRDDVTVHSGFTYYYIVKAYNSGGFSPASSSVRAVVPVGLSDNFIWQNTSGQFVLWVMNQTNFSRYAYMRAGPAASTGWKVVAFPDLDRDHNADILWQNTNGQLMSWMMKGTNFLRSVPLRTGPAASTGWKIVAAPDLTFDNRPDFLWVRNTGATMLWQMSSTNFVREVVLHTAQPTTTGWGVVGCADLNAGGGTDIVWSNTNGMTAVWWMNRTNFLANAPLRTGYTAASGWKFSLLTDLNSDFNTDFVWEKSDGRLEAWLMKGSNYLRSVTLRTNTAPYTGWRLVGPK